MNYRTLVKGALALSLSLIVASASAATTTYNDVQKYGAMFETTVNTPAGAFNDWNYEVTSNVTDYANADAGYGWFSGDPEQDESKIIARTDAAGGQALQLNTDASTLTNKFDSTLAGELNDGIAAAGAYFETEVKFVPSDTLDAGITGNQDATKFAIYAFANEEVEPPVTNLVVYHGVMDTTSGNIWYTNEVFDIDIDATVYTTLRVDMKTITDPGEDPEDTSDDEDYNVFSVKVGNTVLSSETAYAEGKWFLTVEQRSVVANRAVSSLNFKGTGEIDNIKAGTITETTTYAVDWTGSQNVVVSNGTAEVSGTTGNYEAGTVLTFYPTVGLITNVANAAVDPAAASWPYTVLADDTFTVFAGEEPVAPTGFAEGDTYGSVTLTAAQAAWLNTFDNYDAIDAALKTDASGLEKAYLLNVDPLTGDGTLTVTAITVGTDVQVTIALARTEGETAVTGKAINGTLKLFGTADLGTAFAELATATISDDDFSEGDTATATFSGTGAKFFKAVIEEAPAAAQSGE